MDTGARSQLVHGRYMQENDAHGQLFLATNMRTDSEEGDLAYPRRSLEIQGKKSLDLVQLQRPADFDCDSWAQFSIKYILSNPAVNCVLTETTKPYHAVDNLTAGFGRLPDDQTRVRMLEFIQSF